MMIMMMILDACLCSNERKKGYGFGWVGKWKGLGRVEGEPYSEYTV